MVAVVVVLAALGLLALTEQGRQYAAFLGKGLGSLVGSVLKAYPGKTFNFELTVDEKAAYGQAFSMSNSNLVVSGRGSAIKIDDKTWNLGDKEVEIKATGSGDIAFTADGKIELKMDTKTFQIDGRSTNDVKVEVMIVPTAFSLDNIKKDMINITSATGTMLKSFDSTAITANFEKSNLQIDNFSGMLELKNQTTTLSGTAANIQIDGRNV